MEKYRAAVHDVVGADGDVGSLLAPLDPIAANRLIDQVLADYVTELNRALSSADPRSLYGIDASSFMWQYDALWKIKLSL